MGAMLSVKGYWPVVPYFYVGTTLEYTALVPPYDDSASSNTDGSYDYSDVICSTGGLSLLAGVVFPIDPIAIDDISSESIKVFTEIRFGYDSSLSNLITIVGLGLEYTHYEFGLNIQASGVNRGLISVIFGMDFEELLRYIGTF